MPVQFLSTAVLAQLLSAYQASIEAETQVDETSFLSLLDSAGPAGLRAFSTKCTCQPGEIIVRENDPGDSFYIIQSGIAAVVKGNLDAPTTLGFRTPGGMIGEMALLEDQPRSATVVALEPTVLWRMSQDAFYAFSSQNPRFSRKLMSTLSSRLRNSDAERSQEAETGKQREAALTHFREQALRDPLTGLFNRRYLEETLAREISRARRSGSTVGILMLDIDHFKRVNDAYGHPAGDAVLRALAALLGKCTRAEDIPCRFGGEEFVVVMPGAPLPVICDRAEEIRLAFEALRVPAQDQVITMTLSIGVAAYPTDGAAGNEVLDHADQALYQAKAAGRNRVIVFQQGTTIR